MKKGIPVLMYHALSEKGEPTLHRTVISKHLFEAQMTWLHGAGYQSVSPSEARDLLENGGNCRKKVVLTFDDGYHSMWRFAAPVLKRFGFSATLFLLPTSLDWAIFDAPLDVPQHDRPLTTSEVFDLMSMDWKIEPHGLTHRNLKRLRPTAVRQELLESKALVQRFFGKKCGQFAYPYGKYDKNTLKTAQSHFEMAFAVHGGLWTENSALMRIPRIEINRADSLERFERKLKTGFGGKSEWAWGKVKSVVRDAIFSNKAIRKRQL